jgi:Phytochelatin synthase
MTKHQSILPLTALSIDDFQVYERPPWLTTKRWYLGIPSFCLGVLGMAAFFVLHSTTLYNVTDRKNVVDESLLYLNSTFAFTLLADEYGWYDLSRDFFIMQQGWDVQENQVYCPLATAAAILNSLRGMLTLPTDPLYNPYPYATQNGLFNRCTDRNVILRNTTFDGILAAPGGLSLDQTEALLKCHLPSDSWSVDARHVDPSVISIDQMRKALVLSLMSPSSRVLVNFNRAMANQVGEGHFSPIGSYSHAKDAFLIMDVAKYKYPPVWMPTSVLYRALSTVDACGTWDYPYSQVKLLSSHPELLKPRTPEDLTAAFRKLGCKATFRGYIIVKQLDEIV